MFFLQTSGVEFGVRLGTFLALSVTQVKPEMGMPPMRGKQVAHRHGNSPPVAAQHI
ncbi:MULTISPECIES: hypothetical protein [unclassified Mesorhizobium]|nr:MULTISPECIES: hypothetical protein [unclassified Mesorhizobium]